MRLNGERFDVAIQLVRQINAACFIRLSYFRHFGMSSSKRQTKTVICRIILSTYSAARFMRENIRKTSV